MYLEVCPQGLNYERTVYHRIAHTKQRLYDACLVWAFEASGDRCQ